MKEFANYEKITVLISSKKVKEAIKAIALYLGLPIDVNISYVPKGYRPSANDGFQSNYLVKTDQNKRGTGGITAQVSIPSNLPFYGTPSMVNFPINVRLSENCAENPATLISVMAHELSHIVLYSIWHKEKENEFYTDLTAMMLGFADIMRIGRKVIKTTTHTDRGYLSSTTTTHTETTTFGYLSDANFDFAFSEIDSFLSKQRSVKKKLLEKLEQSKKRLKNFQKLSFYLEKHLEYLDKNPNHKYSSEDVYKIGAFHQPGYTDNFRSIVRKNEVIFKEILKFVENLNNYTVRNIETMQQCETQLKSANEELAKHHSLLQKDLDVLKKYVSLFYKLKLKFC